MPINKNCATETPCVSKMETDHQQQKAIYIPTPKMHENLLTFDLP